MTDVYETDIDLSKSFIEILIDGPKNELEVGIVEFIGRHFSDQKIEQALHNNFSINEILQEADKSIEKGILDIPEKELNKKLQHHDRSSPEIKVTREESIKSSPEHEQNEKVNKEAIERVLKIVKNIFPKKKVIDLESISKGFGAVKGAMESENQFIATEVKDVSISELGNLEAPNTPNVNSQNKNQSRER